VVVVTVLGWNKAALVIRTVEYIALTAVTITAITAIMQENNLNGLK
jgi:hypothetical protein